jgi:hypothetical protein
MLSAQSIQQNNLHKIGWKMKFLYTFQICENFEILVACYPKQQQKAKFCLAYSQSILTHKDDHLANNCNKIC